MNSLFAEKKIIFFLFQREVYFTFVFQPQAISQIVCVHVCVKIDTHAHMHTHTLSPHLCLSLSSGDALYILCRVITDPAE